MSQQKVCVQIAALCATAQVPNFDAETVKQALKLFTQLQNVILTAGRAKIGTFADLGKYLLINNTEGCVHLMQELVPLIGKLKDVFTVFLKPQIVAIHLLALPVVIGLLDDRKMRSSAEPEEPATILAFRPKPSDIRAESTAESAVPPVLVKRTSELFCMSAIDLKPEPLLANTALSVISRRAR